MGNRKVKTELDSDFRKEMGLPPITSEEGAAEVDVPLIEQFLSDADLADADAERVLDYIGRFSSWREQYTRIVIEKYRASHGTTNRPNFPEPS